MSSLFSTSDSSTITADEVERVQRHIQRNIQQSIKAVLNDVYNPNMIVNNNESRELLKELVNALDNAHISSWQSTAAWQEQLDQAKAFLEQTEEQ